MWDEVRQRRAMREGGWFNAMRVDPRPPWTAVWPGAPYDSIWVGEHIRRDVEPRRPAYPEPKDERSRRFLKTFCDEVDQVIARRIRTVRVRTGLRQIDLAACIGVTPATMCRIERGKRPVTFSEIVRIATQLAAPIDAFIEPPTDHAPTRWARRPRNQEPRTQEELDELERIIFEEELPDLMDLHGVKTREEMERIWWPDDERRARIDAIFGPQDDDAAG